ncbi:uncharacterized protein LOC113549139 [Rhopalosiphum maidis]|uniref:uncharacterized protein LOC113549139 n=1 Tax=Rhopalosiphum maidis TaxID=43146 RepID=UPI000EFFDA1C|nr:uncharacterized protein LOC113549139 [Rhopalosiphum maidis]
MKLCIIRFNSLEREKGKTVEVGRAYFETERKHFTILDAPGHKSFVPNMIGGTAQADLAVLTTETIDTGNMVVIFLPQRILIRIEYWDMVDRVNAAKYNQRPCPLVNCTDQNYLVWGQESHLITRFEMDDGDEYYVLTTCSLDEVHRYNGLTVFFYSPSPWREIVSLINNAPK